jgi:energy-coupling factor transporter ATP-binding protein EcfA2
MEIVEIKSKLTIRNVLSYYGINTGKKYILCPFHQTNDDKKLGMVVNDKSNTVYCFSSKCKCGMKAIDVIDFILHKENIDKHGALTKATELIEQGYITKVDSLQENSLQNKNEKILSLSPSLSLSVITQHKLQYETETIIYFILGGLPKTLDSLKVTLQINNKQEKTDYSYRTKVDLYEYKQVEKTAKEIAEKLNLHQSEVERDLMKLADLLDKYREEQEQKNEIIQEQKEETIIITEKEKQEIETLLKDKNLIDNLSKLLGKTGIVGEENNRMSLFVIALSHKINDTLHALIQGSSGSGKTRLLKQISDCIPKTSVTKLTRLSDKVLYNYPENYFVNRLLCLEDIDGLSEEAEFAFRELQSNGELNSATSMKLENGQITSGQKTVKGPIASLCCTTKGEIYEDNMSRCFLIAVDESKEQTQRIINYQNKKASGKINTKEEQNTKLFLQKVVESLRSYEVINPYAEQIKLPETAHKIRRLNELFQAFIKQITLLHQKQRTLKENKLIASIEDVEQAIKILFESIVLKVDELDGSLRQFYEKLKIYINKKGTKYEFTRFEIREATGLSKTQQHHYINQLVVLEYIEQSGFANKGFKYKIKHWDNHQALRGEIRSKLEMQILAIKANTTEH